MGCFMTSEMVFLQETISSKDIRLRAIIGKVAVREGCYGIQS